MGAAGELRHLTDSLDWDLSTRKRLAEAAKLFEAGRGIPAALRSGDYSAAASLISQLASTFPGERRNGLLSAARYLEQAGLAWARIGQRDYAGAAAILGRMASVPALLPGSAAQRLQGLAQALGTIEDVRQAVRTGDMARAAKLLASNVSIGPEAQTAVLRAASVLTTLSQVRAAFEAKEWSSAIQAVSDLLTQLETPPSALVSGLGRLQRAISAGNERLIEIEARSFSSLLEGVASEIAQSLGRRAEEETRAVLGSQAGALATATAA